MDNLIIHKVIWKGVQNLDKEIQKLRGYLIKRKEQEEKCEYLSQEWYDCVESQKLINEMITRLEIKIVTYKEIEKELLGVKK